jgi:hypothetical protein
MRDNKVMPKIAATQHTIKPRLAIATRSDANRKGRKQGQHTAVRAIGLLAALAFCLFFWTSAVSGVSAALAALSIG